MSAQQAGHGLTMPGHWHSFTPLLYLTVHSFLPSSLPSFNHSFTEWLTQRLIAWVLKPIYLDSNSGSANHYVNAASYLPFHCLHFLIYKMGTTEMPGSWGGLPAEGLKPVPALETTCSPRVRHTAYSVAIYQEAAPRRALGWAATRDPDLGSQSSPIVKG